MDPRLRHGIDLFNRGEFFECHEVLEEAWTPERGPRRLFLQALIHVAVGWYHYERGNALGAERQLRKALRKLSPYLPGFEGVDTARLQHDAQSLLRELESGGRAQFRPLYHRYSTNIAPGSDRNRRVKPS